MKRNIRSLEFFQNLTSLPYVERIILYGSRSRGDASDRSDIDLAIFCPSASSIDWLRVVDVIDEADTLLKIDCVRLDQLSITNSLRLKILEEGEVLYERSKNK